MSISFDDESLDAVPQKVFRKLMDDTFSADEQEKVLREFLTPIFDNIVATCEEFDMPYDEELTRRSQNLPTKSKTKLRPNLEPTTVRRPIPYAMTNPSSSPNPKRPIVIFSMR